MMTVYRWKFVVAEEKIVFEKDCSEGFYKDDDWEWAQKTFTDRNNDRRDQPDGLIYYAEARVEDDGSFKVV